MKCGSHSRCVVKDGVSGGQRNLGRGCRRRCRHEFEPAVVDRFLQQHRAVELVAVQGPPRDRKSVVSGKSVSGRVYLGGRRIMKKTKHTNNEIGSTAQRISKIHSM